MAATPEKLTNPAIDLLAGSSHDELAGPLDAPFAAAISQCMHAAGLPYVPNGPAMTDKGVDGINFTTRSSSGYGIWDSESSQDVVTPRDKLVAKLSPAERERWYNTLSGTPDTFKNFKLPGGGAIRYPSNGCTAAARRKLGGGDIYRFVRLTYEPASVEHMLESQVKSSTEFLAKTKIWSECMNQKGFPYTSPQAAINGVAQQYKTNGHTVAIRRLETRVAVADGRCQVQVKLPETKNALLARYADKLSPQIIDDLNDLARFEQEMIARVAAA